MNFGNGVAEIQQKYERERGKAEERKFWISAMASPKFLLPKPTDREINYGNAIAEISKKKKIVAMPLPKMGGKNKNKNSGCRNHMWGI